MRKDNPYLNEENCTAEGKKLLDNKTDINTAIFFLEAAIQQNICDAKVNNISILEH